MKNLSNFLAIMFGMKFDLSDVKDENEFDKHEQTRNFESCPYFLLSDEKVNNEKLKILFTHSNEVSIQESIQEYLQGDVPLFVVQHVYRDPYLLDEDP